MEDDVYLQPGFDAKSLTVPLLRNVLVKHDIRYSSSAKKIDLVRLFNNEIASRAADILASHTQVQRSCKGITDAQPRAQPFTKALKKLPKHSNDTGVGRSRRPITRQNTNILRDQGDVARDTVSGGNEGATTRARARSNRKQTLENRTVTKATRTVGMAIWKKERKDIEAQLEEIQRMTVAYIGMIERSFKNYLTETRELQASMPRPDFSPEE